MDVRTPCPQPSFWKGLLDGTLPPTEEKFLHAHLEGCVRCQETLQGLAAGSESWKGLPRIFAEGEPAEEPALREVMAEMAGRRELAETQTELPNFLAPSPDPQHLGRLGAYEVEELIGRGGMGMVFRAFDPKLERPVAIKVMAPELAAQPSARERFLREARTAALVCHEHVVTIHAVDESRGLPYLVMQFVAGGSLEERLAREGPLPLPELLRVGIQVASGLGAAHARGLVHRDIKPANILLDGGRVKITDFGLARAVDDLSLSQSGQVTGTPEYMAPEQARGDFVDHRADLFSLGSLLYALGTGRSPFQGGNPLAVLRRVCDDTPPPVNEVNPALPRWLAAIIGRLHAKDPAQRFQSAAEVGNLLERHFQQLQRTVPPVPKDDGVWSGDHAPARGEHAPARERAPAPTGARKLAVTIVEELPAPPERRRWKGIALALVLLIGLPALGLFAVGFYAFRGGSRDEGDRQTVTGPSASGVPATPVAAAAGGADKSDKANLPRQAQQILAIHCHRCHGENGTVEGGFNYLMDREQLVKRQKIVPGQPARSSLLQRIEAGEMPPEGESPRPGAEDIVLLRRWVEDGAPAFASSPAPRRFINDAEMVGGIETDLRKRNERDRRFTRYFTLTHLYNVGLLDDELQTYRNGLAKLLNSLSWERKIVVPEPIDPARTVLRIDLRDYRWSERQWESLLADYPYARAANIPLQHLRGDWFVAIAARPPLYHRLLDLPGTERELEKLLHIDVEADILAGRVARAGFNGSGVSRNNRLIERHATSDGAYWKSYDFAQNDGAQNLFERPLGPGSDGRSFRHVGGEIIFNLPNGLQGYMLVNGKGQRIDKGPTDIVSDPKRPDRAVENGLSCMSCHSRGINPKADQIRAHVEQNRKAFAERGEVESILALYPPADQFDALIRQDAERFQKAVVQTGAKAGATEPIMALASQFEAPLDLRRAAAETGLEPPSFLALLEQTPHLGRTIGALKIKGGTVQRQTFARAFSDLVSEGRGNAGTPTLPKPPVVVEQPHPSPAPPVSEPKLPGGKAEVKLPEPFAQVHTGGGGRYLIFQLKKAKKLAIFDVTQAKVVRELDAPEDARYAADRDKLMVVLPGQRLIQRWDLHTFEREKTVPAPDGVATWVLMGCNGTGPLWLLIGGKFVAWDVERMELMYMDGSGLGGSSTWGFQGSISADGQALVVWHGGISGQQFVLVRPRKTKNILLPSPDAHSFNGRWAMPNADASMIFRFGAGIYDGQMKTIAADAFHGAILLPTQDARFFLAVRGETRETNQVTICTSTDLTQVFTVRGVEAMTGSIINSLWGHVSGEPRVRYLPTANVLVNLPESNDRVVIRRLDLIEELNRSGQDYLFIVSRPPNPVAAGSAFHYRMDIRSKSDVVRCTLETGPEGMTVSNSGVVRWNAPTRPEKKSARVIITVRSASGKEVQHSFDLAMSE